MLKDTKNIAKYRRQIMTCSERVSQWTQTVSSQLPHLSRRQASVLALWSLGMVLAYSQKGSWQRYWQGWWAQLAGVIPGDWTVLVLADRGLYAPWLYRQIVAQGWHAFLRINVGAKACLQGSDRWEWIAHWVSA